MFNEIYHKILSELTRKNRREMQRIASTILLKGVDSPKLTKKELLLIDKMKNWIQRSYFEFDYSLEELLNDCRDSLTNKQAQRASQQFVANATRQSASEKAQIRCMLDKGFQISKMSASGTNSLRFDENSINLVPVKIEGITSRSFDYKLEYNGWVEYFMGKVVFSQGGHQDSVKSEIVDFLQRSNSFLNQNLECKCVFTALIDGDSLTKKDIKKFSKYTSDRVRLMTSDTYQLYLC